MLDMVRVCCGKMECAKIVDDALRHFDGDRLALISSVVMPNHVHALLVQNADTSVGRFASQLENLQFTEHQSVGRTLRDFMAKKLLRSSRAETKNIFAIVSATSGVIQRRHI